MVVATDSSTSPRPLARHIRGFGKSSAYSLGVEEEFQLVDPATYELVPRVNDVMAELDGACGERIKHELMQSVIETATDVCGDVSAAVDDVLETRTRIRAAAERCGVALASAGTTPVSCWEEQVITDKPRYRDIVARLQWIARRELIFGMHVHVGVDSADKCAYVFNAIRADLPLLLALSTNSPFWQGSVTGLQSSRIKVFDAFPRSGMPAALRGGWDDFEALMARGAKTGRIPDHTYVWWDVRPHPEFGTIEVRICDAQTRARDTVALASVIQALVAWHGDRFDQGVALGEEVPQMLIEENRWSAARYGLDGEMIDFDTDELVATRHLAAKLFDRIEPVAARLGAKSQFEAAAGLLDRTGASRQLQAWLDGGKSTVAVGKQLVHDTALDM